MQQRPTGVIVLGVLAIIWGIFGLCGSALLLLGDTLLARREALRVGAPPAALAPAILILTLILLVQSLLYIIFGVGALQFSRWAWTLGITLALVGLVVRLAGLVLDHRAGAYVDDIVGLVVDVLVLIYLFRPHVQQAFGRAA